MKTKTKLTIFLFLFLLAAGGFANSAFAFSPGPGATNVYYSVGQSTANLMTGTPTMTMTSGAAVFSTAQTGNIGVGDRVTYNPFTISSFASGSDSSHTLVTTTAAPTFQNGDYVAISGTTNYNGTFLVSGVSGSTFDIDTPYTSNDATGTVANIAYIASKTDSTGEDWQLVNSLGAVPNDVATAATVVSITHEYTSLEAAVAGASDINHLNTINLGASGSASGETDASGNGSTLAFSYNLAYGDVTASSLSVGYTIGGTAYAATDNGSGTITGTDLSGTINYTTGAVALTFTAAPDSSTNITGSYSYTGANVILNIPCYYDSGPDTTAVTVSGYTTSATNYIKIYTPHITTTYPAEANNSQRAEGKWDGTKYNLNYTVTGNYQQAIYSGLNYTEIDGLQIYIQGNQYGEVGINFPYNVNFSGMIVKNNIVKSNYPSDTNSTGINKHGGGSVVNNAEIYNNILYGLNVAITTDDGGNVYNNTISNSGTGIYYAGATAPILKNNIVQNCATDYGGVAQYSSFSTNNLSSDATAPPYGTYYTNATVAFQDAANDDFHLSPTDTAAKGAGVNLSSGDPYLNFSTDIDGQTRPSSGAWDIGADQSATPIYYSVGQNTSDHKTGSPTVTISGGVATFNFPQTASNMGVGDAVTYNGSTVAYITRKIDTSNWGVETATGAVPANVSSAETVNSIAHAFSSLEGAVDASTSTGAFDANHLNTKDLYANNYVLNIPCYYDTGPDTTAVTVQDWTTADPNYIKIYTPDNTSTQVNQSQRAMGKWDIDKYRLETAVDSGVIGVSIGNVHLDGLQVQAPGALIYGGAVNFSSSGGENVINNSIIKAQAAGTGLSAISVVGGSAVLAIYNNIIYNFNGSSDHGIDKNSSVNNYVYNNTIVNCSTGIWAQSGVIVAKNNIVQGGNAGYSGTFISSSNNLSSDGTAPGSNAVTDATVAFANAVADDFHLSPNDTVAKGQGVDLSADPDLAFDTDINGQPRIDPWSIGADQGPEAVVGTAGTSGTSNMSFGTAASYCVPGSTDPCAAPVAEWDMNDDVKGAGQTIADSSGNGNDGTTYGSVMDCTVQGKFGKGCKFDGTDDYINVGPKSDLEVTSNFTFSAWINVAPSALTNENEILMYDGGWSVSNGSFIWGTATNGSKEMSLNFQNGTSNDAFVRGSTPLTAGWHYVAAVHTGGMTQLYLDGAPDGPDQAQRDPVYSTDHDGLSIGAFNSGTPTAFMDGLIDQVRVYNYARTPAQIAWEYNQGGPVAEWKMDECAGTTLHDSSGNGNTGTLVIGSSGSQTQAGTCADGLTTSAWYNGRNGRYNASLNFDGTDDYVSVGATIPTVNAVSVWIKPTSLTQSILDLDGGTHTLAISNGAVTATGFSSYYVDGKLNGTVSDTGWHQITAIANAPFATTASLKIGAVGASYFAGQLDDVALFDYPLTAAQVANLYNDSSAVNFGN